MVDLVQFATGGATRPDSFTGMQPDFSSALGQLFASAPPEIKNSLLVSSGYRSPERQAQLWSDALNKYGSASEARKWVAPPGNSQHNKGNAADLKYASAAAREWAHANAGAYGLAFPLSNEPWHIELSTARGQPATMLGYAPTTKKTPAQAAIEAATGAPVMRPKAQGFLGNAWNALTGGVGNAVQVAEANAQPLMRSAASIDPRAEVMKRISPGQLLMMAIGNSTPPVQGGNGLLNPITQRSEAWLNATGSNQPIMVAARAPMVGAAGVRGQNGSRDFGNRTSEGTARSLV